MVLNLNSLLILIILLLGVLSNYFILNKFIKLNEKLDLIQEKHEKLSRFLIDQKTKNKSLEFSVEEIKSNLKIVADQQLSQDGWIFKTGPFFDSGQIKFLFGVTLALVFVYFFFFPNTLFPFMPGWLQKVCVSTSNFCGYVKSIPANISYFFSNCSVEALSETVAEAQINFKYGPPDHSLSDPGIEKAFQNLVSKKLEGDTTVLTLTDIVTVSDPQLVDRVAAFAAKFGPYFQG